MRPKKRIFLTLPYQMLPSKQMIWIKKNSVERNRSNRLEIRCGITGAKNGLQFINFDFSTSLQEIKVYILVEFLDFVLVILSF